MSYCRKCGKKLEDNAELCENCRNEELVFGDGSEEVTSAVSQAGKKDGFVKALLSVILPYAASVLFGVVLGVIIGFGLLDTLQKAGIVIVGMLFIAPMVISIIFGIQSIKAFVRNKREGRAKPIATLVLGIIGLATSASSVIMFVLTRAYYVLVGSLPNFVVPYLNGLLAR